MARFDPTRPGPFIRERVLPAGLTVKAAAEKLGVGRPAFSNLLNGKASLSSDMAMRIEKAFGYDSKKLLELQAAHDRAQAQMREPRLAVRAYAPSFLTIKAQQIEAWSQRMEARSEFAGLLRRLVYSTGQGLVRLDCPAYENAQRPDWDGVVDAEAATPWIPLGESGWEFGVNQDPRQKADHDYRARTAEIAPQVRAQMTFVFVTSRNWAGKAAWLAAKTSDKAWKAVRAYDASDLEQWTETSVPAQIWFSGRLEGQDPDLWDLQTAWRKWADATTPPLSKSLFKLAAPAAARRLKDWLQQPASQPFTVVADSHQEGLAALACAFEAEGLELERARERVVVVRSPKALALLSSATSPLIVVITAPEVQAEAGGLFRQHHTIVVTNRNRVEGRPDFAVDLVDDRTFHDALTEMGLGHDEVQRMDRQSGRSLTVLRRRMSSLSDVKSPPWAASADTARALIPLMMLGAWDSDLEADRAVVARLADRSGDQIEATVTEWVGQADSPLWAIGTMRGVVSKTDAFFAVRQHITGKNLRDFFDVARVVLAEKDSTLSLPFDERWAASIYDKTRRHSEALRRSLCETLVLLSVHSDNLFRRLGLDPIKPINSLIRDLLTPLNDTTWHSQQHDLPRYAEAAPETFLDVLENDLRDPTPTVYALFQAAGSGVFSSPGRTGLLWALEVLAWDKNLFFRVVTVLAKLAEIRVNDKAANTPHNSLASIFCYWVPQTAAPLERRIQALEMLARRYPTVGWRICVDQFDPWSTARHYNTKPQWRSVPVGAGEPVTGNEAYGLARRAFEIAIAWPAHNENTLVDLVERLDRISDNQNAVWDAIRTWLNTGPSDAAKAKLREQIRVSAMLPARRGVSPEARALLDALEPTNLIWRHQWLFSQHVVRETAEELGNEAFDFSQHEARIERRRLDALREIWQTLGLDGVRDVCRLCATSVLIGGLLAKFLTMHEIEMSSIEIVERQAEPSLLRCLSGLLWCVTKDVREKILKAALEAGEEGSPFSRDGRHRLLLHSPFGPETWAVVAKLSAGERIRYWTQVLPQLLLHERPDEVNQVVDELLNVKRPRATFEAVHIVFNTITTDRLLRLLNDIATVQEELVGYNQVSPHDISKAFDVLSARSDADPGVLARLEFMHIDGLKRTKHGIQNLERHLSESPKLFVEALSLIYSRRDGGGDTAERLPNDLEAAQRVAHSAYVLLSRAHRLPGSNDKGELDRRKLREWIVAARTLARECGREEVGDIHIGQLLSHSAPGTDGVWPIEAVREVLEDLGTPHMANGMLIGYQNARGATFRDAGGDLERSLAETYRDWARRVEAHYPFTARLLDSLAKSYDGYAQWHDDRSVVEKRLSR